MEMEIGKEKMDGTFRLPRTHGTRENFVPATYKLWLVGIHGKTCLVGKPYLENSWFETSLVPRDQTGRADADSYTRTWTEQSGNETTSLVAHSVCK